MSDLTAAKTKFEPAYPEARRNGARNMVDNICKAIHYLDIVIEDWSVELNRAQPHRDGRLVVKFTKTDQITCNGVVAYDIGPVVGRMKLLKNGSWHFFRLDNKVRYERLSDLRVGKTLRSDPLVVRLINGIEDLLKKRKELCAPLAALSRGMSGRIASAHALCSSYADTVCDLAERNRLDWSQGAAKAEESLRTQRRERYLRKKLKESSIECMFPSPLDAL